MSVTPQNPVKMPERFLSLVRRCRVSAMVLGKGDDFKLLYLSDPTNVGEIAAAALNGLRPVGVIGFTGKTVLLEAEEPIQECERILKLAAPDFMLAALETDTGGSVN